jgi:YfiH family protein
VTAPWLAADWPAPPGVRALTTLRHGPGVSEPPFDAFNLGNRHSVDGDDPAAVERNRALLVEHAGLPSTPHWLRQVHGVQVVRADTGGFAAGDGHALAAEPEADASVTSTPGTVLAILTADCLPVLFCADDGSEIAAAHAGWRGLAGGVLEATLAAMRTPASRVLAWLGPAAGPQQYEVGIEVFDAFVAQDWQAAGAFASTRPQHWRVDLYALARRRLALAGVASERIFGGGLCTISEPGRFFSHRRDRRTGRMASLIWIEPAQRN